MQLSLVRSSTLVMLILGWGCASKDGDAGDGPAGGTTATTGDVGASTFGGDGGGDDDGGDGNDGPNDTAPSDDEGTAGGTDDGPGGSFVLRPDGGGVNECDPKIQDCPRGEKCTAWANDGGTFWNANRCIEVTGEGVGGDECLVEGGGVSGLDDCGVGYICMNTDKENVGTCIRFCTGEDADCEAGDVCAIYNDGVLPICLLACDPLLQNCAEGQSCIDTPNQTFICFTDASGAGGAEGEACPAEHGENSCDPGMWCGPGLFGCPQVNCCTPYCELSNDTCNGPNECTSFYGDVDAAPPGLEDVGVCVTPA